ncbi:MAG: hypothetical protein ACJA04_000121 [Cellvibrionaceae bacterium]|jgi:hypothetical protein
MGNFTGHSEQSPLAEREAVNITPETFNEVMAAANIAVTLSGKPPRIAQHSLDRRFSPRSPYPTITQYPVLSAHQKTLDPVKKPPTQ